MTQTVTLQLPGETLQRYQRDAAVAHKALEEFLAERLIEAVPPLADDLPSRFESVRYSNRKRGERWDKKRI